MERAMIGKLAIAVSAVGLATLMTYPLVLQGQTPAPTVDSIAPKSTPQQGADVPARKAAMSASDEQDAMILARQGLMEGIYQYMDDADDWTGQSAGASDAAMLQALTREAAHTALMLPAFKQLFPPFTNPESPEFSSMFETYALPGIWAKPDIFSADLDATVAALNVLSMARDRSEYARRLEVLQATCDACHDHFRRVYVSPLDPK
jgi:cytochrome c556